ncbi:MAG: Asp-tRNA(Asn)/Glu-tRNA(Gln) amidotransferase subunit GatC [Candidatus Doudnabacteria bacterium]|nr:Asp-tRNA(Asn)/Glu-tRNA(Gln) amidotransferase subunit GatC [Candidatus Doudnabacteria bacterium]
MSISTEEVNRIAKLARLSFDDEQKQKLQHELSAILEYVDQLKQVGDKVSTEVYDEETMNLMREDVVEERTSPEEFLKQSPAREGNFVKVKSILE